MPQTWLDYMLSKPAGDVQRAFRVPAPLVKRWQSGQEIRFSKKTVARLRNGYKREQHRKLRAAGLNIKDARSKSGMAPEKVIDFVERFENVVDTLAKGNNVDADNIRAGLAKSSRFKTITDYERYIDTRNRSGWAPVLVPQGAKWTNNKRRELSEWAMKNVYPMLEKIWLKGVPITNPQKTIEYIKKNESLIVKPFIKSNLAEPSFKKIKDVSLRKTLAENDAYKILDKSYTFLSELSGLNLRKIERWIEERHT